MSTQSRDAYDIVREIWNKETISLYEEFKILLLNRHNKIIGHYSLSRGSINSIIVDVRLVFAVALKTAATDIILVHYAK